MSWLSRYHSWSLLQTAQGGGVVGVVVVLATILHSVALVQRSLSSLPMLILLLRPLFLLRASFPSYSSFLVLFSGSLTFSFCCFRLCELVRTTTQASLPYHWPTRTAPGCMLWCAACVCGYFIFVFFPPISVSRSKAHVFREL